MNDVMGLIKNQNFVIYGNGYIAKRLYCIVQEMGVASNVIAVAVTKKKDDENGVDGKPVKEIKDIRRDVNIIIAAHDAVSAEMENNLKRLGFKFYVWIYPYIIELELGKPIKKNCTVPVKDIIANMSKSYSPAICYYTLQDYCSNKNYSGELYVKMMEKYTTKETAQKRWNRFRSRIDECLKKGFAQDYNIKVLNNFNLIDGMHRVVLAKYFGKNVLNADVYIGGDEFYSKYDVGGDILIRENDLHSYYNDIEIQRIKEADKKLRVLE